MKRAVLALIACLWAMPALAAIDIQEVVSPKGIRAWLVEDHQIPFVALELRFKGGSSLDPVGKRGAVNLMTALLEEGSGDLDARAFAEAREALAAGFSFDVGDDSLSVSARFLTENRNASVELLRGALMAPRFDADAIERVRGQVLSGIDADKTDPNAIAGRTFDSLAYSDHPYATSNSGTEETVASLTRDDLVQAKDAVLARDRVFVSAVGDIDAASLGQVLDRLLGDLPATGAPLPGRADLKLTGGVTVVDYASPQSVVVFGEAGIDRDDPNFFAAFVLNQIVGGSGFSARLMDEVREKRGLTYGISTYLINMEYADTWQGSFSSSNEKVAEAVDVVRNEWAKVARDGVTATELDAAKTYLTGAYPLRFDGNGPIADILVGMQIQGLTPDYVKRRNALVEAVTAEDVKRVAARLMQPDALRFVVVGRPVGLTSTD